MNITFDSDKKTMILAVHGIVSHQEVFHFTESDHNITELMKEGKSAMFYKN